MLRGIGFLGGAYSDSTVTPLSGAPGTELQTAHTSFGSPTFYPTQLWTANYFDTLDGGGGHDAVPDAGAAPCGQPGRRSVTLRKYDDLKVRLFYSNSTADAKSAAPSSTGSPATFTAGRHLHRGPRRRRPQGRRPGGLDHVTRRRLATCGSRSISFATATIRPSGLPRTRCRRARILRPGRQRLRPREPERQLGRLLPGRLPGLDARAGPVALGGDSDGTFGATPRSPRR